MRKEGRGWSGHRCELPRVRGWPQEVPLPTSRGSVVPATEAPWGREDKAGGRMHGRQRVKEQVAGTPVRAQGVGVRVGGVHWH